VNDMTIDEMIEERDTLLEQSQALILQGRIELARMAIEKAAELDDMIEAQGKVTTAQELD
jgi:phage shock protein A